jgi:hypothetical protein
VALDEVGEERAHKGRRKITFPITKQPEDFRSHPALAFFSDTAKAVLDYMQPYKRRHIPDHLPVDAEPLLMLNELSIADKHRVLHGAFTQLDLTDTRFRPRAIHVEDLIDGTSVEVTISRGDTFEDGTRVALIRFPGFGPPETTKVDVTNQPTASIRFGPGADAPLLCTLCAHTG